MRGSTGITLSAQAKPDGYTTMIGHMGTHGAASRSLSEPQDDPVKDFEPIGLAAGTPILIVARKDFAARQLKRVRRAGKESSREAQPGARRRRIGVVHDLHASYVAAQG